MTPSFLLPSSSCTFHPDVSFTRNGAQRLAENPDVIFFKTARCMAVLDRLSVISPPFLNRFTSGFHQNYLRFKGYKVSYNRMCPHFRSNFEILTSTLKIGEGAPPPFWGGAGSPSNTNSPGLRPTSIPSGILVHPALWA